MKHLLLTRFSVPSVLGGKSWKLDGNFDYMTYRFGLFERFCFPSVQAQTCRDFVWFVLFGRDSTDIVRNWVSDHQDTQLFTPLFCTSFEESIEDIRTWARVNVPIGDQIITSRFDNDDALSAHYVERVQRVADPKTNEMYIDSVEGHQLVAKGPEVDWKLYSYRYWANPFVSMVERVTEAPIKTVFNRKHGSIRPDLVGCPVAPIHELQWLQVLHGKNIGNRLWGKRQVRPAVAEFPWLPGAMTKQ